MNLNQLTCEMMQFDVGHAHAELLQVTPVWLRQHDVQPS